MYLRTFGPHLYSYSILLRNYFTNLHARSLKLEIHFSGSPGAFSLNLLVSQVLKTEPREEAAPLCLRRVAKRPRIQSKAISEPPIESSTQPFLAEVAHHRM